MPTWQELVADKRARQADETPKDWLIVPPPTDRLNVVDFPRECGLLSPKEIEITETSDVDVLLRNLASGVLSSVEVTTAFYKRAIIAHQTVNPLTEIFVKRALARAKWCDDQLKASGRPIGPLHGLPISLKDQICINGLETSMGYVGWLGKPAEKDAILTEILHNAGAVPFVRTNVPQTLMWGETYNHVFGRTLNPYNRKLTSGGSSGGEGALIAMKGSPLGVGSDIGGSIRIPAAFCGIYGLRPSYNRIPYYGTLTSLEGQDSMPSVLGPMSDNLNGIKVFMKTVIDQKPWTKDPSAVHKPWIEEEYQLCEHGGGKKLVFGIMWNDGIIVPHPPIIRALELTKKALLIAGHEVVDWVPHRHAEITRVVAEVFAACADEDSSEALKLTGEPLVHNMADVEFVSSDLPNDSISAFQLWQIHKRKLALRKSYLDHWQATKAITSTGRPIDAIIAPVACGASMPHGENLQALLTLRGRVVAHVSPSYTQYTGVFNLLDYPSCVFPVTRVDPAIDVKKRAHRFLNKRDERCYRLYDPELWRDAPVSLQLVGQSYEDEAVVAMTGIVDAALKAQKSTFSLDIPKARSSL
ncbi:general amidase [Vararia minispora EC-137]|uniref:General amidase n=1 Tax=Vararia minispora EC-137 TaxID=1314806 RepID=A0ACB8QMS1_9AGAM|nr:general amidase [Vararia minispora EC-137]